MESVAAKPAEANGGGAFFLNGKPEGSCGGGDFQMPVHYPRYSREDYEAMPEWKLDRLLALYGLPIAGDLAYKRSFAIGAFLWPPNSGQHRDWMDTMFLKRCNQCTDWNQWMNGAMCVRWHMNILNVNVWCVLMRNGSFGLYQDWIWSDKLLAWFACVQLPVVTSSRFDWNKLSFENCMIIER